MYASIWKKIELIHFKHIFTYRKIHSIFQTISGFCTFKEWTKKVEKLQNQELRGEQNWKGRKDKAVCANITVSKENWMEKSQNICDVMFDWKPPNSLAVIRKHWNIFFWKLMSIILKRSSLFEWLVKEGFRVQPYLPFSQLQMCIKNKIWVKNCINAWYHPFPGFFNSNKLYFTKDWLI